MQGDDEYLDYEDSAAPANSGSEQPAARGRIACWDSKAEHQFQQSGAEYLSSCTALAAEATGSDPSALAERCRELLQRLMSEHAQPGSQFEQQLEQVLEKGPLKPYDDSSQFCFVHGYGRHITLRCNQLPNNKKPSVYSSVVHPSVVLRLQRAAAKQQQQLQRQQQQKAGQQKRSAPARSEERPSKKAAAVAAAVAAAPAGEMQPVTPQPFGCPQATLQMFAQPSLDSNAAVISMLQSSFQDLQQEAKQLREYNLCMNAQLAAANERLRQFEANKVHYKRQIQELQEEVERLCGFEERCRELERRHVERSPSRSST